METKKKRILTEAERTAVFLLFKRGVPQSVTSKFLNMSLAHVFRRYQKLRQQNVKVSPILGLKPAEILKKEGFNDDINCAQD